MAEIATSSSSASCRKGNVQIVHDVRDNHASTERTIEPSEENDEASAVSLTRKDVFVVGCILFTELGERLAYYSIAANMLLFCTSVLELPSGKATMVTLVFAGTSYVMPVFGGFIADAWTGKFNTILASGLIYFLGLVLSLASAVDYTVWFGIEHDIKVSERRAFFFVALTFVVIGTGGMKANICPFGAQQVEHLGIETVQSYFNWYYWFINVGAMIAVTVVAYVQQEVGFDYGLVIPLCSMVLALVIFVTARSKYRAPGPEGNLLGTATRVCAARLSGLKTPSFRNSRTQYGGHYEDKFVEGVKAVVRLLPLFGLIIVYWAVYSQMNTTFFLQTERMNLTVDTATLPPAVVTIFNAMLILIIVPIMDRVVYPLLKRHGKSPSNLQRIGLGMMFAVVAMIYAGALEIVRKNDMTNHGYIQQEIQGDNFNASKISVFAQIPEFALIGTSEVFTSISGLELAYTDAPSSMKGLIIGIYLFTRGLGSYLASLIVLIVQSWRSSEASDWFPTEPNDGHMEYLMFLWGTLAFVNVLLFMVATRWYGRKKQQQLLDNMEEDQEDMSI